MFMVVVALVTLSGTVVLENTPVPGTTVTMTRGTLVRETITNEHGYYSFRGVSEGTYDMRYELDGLKSAESRITVEQSDVIVPPQQLEFDVENTVTLSCGRPCNDEPPENMYDLALCSDYWMHTDWIQAAEKGDRSAAALLRTRYALSLSGYERHRLGAVLMRDDAGIFGELMADAELSTKFPKTTDGELSPAYLEWAAARELPAEEHWWLSHDALTYVASDSRSRTLLLSLLATDDRDLVWAAITGLSDQRDTSSLPAIARALARFPGDDAASMAFSLLLMLSPEADELAMQYLEGDSRDNYMQSRAEFAATLKQ